MIDAKYAQLSITLPNEMAEQVPEKVAGGEYATESEVIRDGLRTLLTRYRAVDVWLREEVVPAYAALRADGKARHLAQWNSQTTAADRAKIAAKAQ